MKQLTRYLTFGALALLLALVAAGCASESATVRGAQEVPVEPPWGDVEEAEYILRNDEGDEIGTGTLRVEADGDSYRLLQTYVSPTDRDELVSVVTADGLQPIRFERSVNQDGDVRGVEAQFTQDQVLATFTHGGDPRDRTADRPDNTYDNESLLFLWRAMPLEDDFSARVAGVAFDVRAQNIAMPVATVRVVREETLEVPAGAFEVWRVEAVSGGGTVTAWIGQEPPHYLVKYDSGREVVYELAAVPTAE